MELNECKCGNKIITIVAHEYGGGIEHFAICRQCGRRTESTALGKRFVKRQWDSNAVYEAYCGGKEYPEAIQRMRENWMIRRVKP